MLHCVPFPRSVSGNMVIYKIYQALSNKKEPNYVANFGIHSLLGQDVGRMVKLG